MVGMLAGIAALDVGVPNLGPDGGDGLLGTPGMLGIDGGGVDGEGGGVGRGGDGGLLLRPPPPGLRVPPGFDAGVEGTGLDGIVALTVFGVDMVLETCCGVDLDGVEKVTTLSAPAVELGADFS